MKLRLITTDIRAQASIGWGITEDSSKIVRFVADKVEGIHYADRLDAGELVDLTIEPWQIVDVSDRPGRRFSP